MPGQAPELSSYDRTVHYVEDNRALILGIVAGIVLAVLLVMGFLYWRGQQAEEAATLLADPVRIYEAGDYQRALDDQGEQPGLRTLADEYGSTKAGQLATYYAGDALFRLGQYDEALEYFEDYDGDDTFVAASALAGQAAIYESKSDNARAATLYRRAADTYRNPAVAPGYYLSALRNFVLAGNADEATETYDALQEAYPDVQEVGEAEYYLGMAEAGGAAE